MGEVMVKAFENPPSPDIFFTSGRIIPFVLFVALIKSTNTDGISVVVVTELP